MNTQDNIKELSARFPGINVSAVAEAYMMCILPDKELIYPLCEFLKNDLGYDYLQFLTCIDRLDRLELQYHLYSYGQRCKIVLKTSVVRTKGSVRSVSAVWKTADWHERETYDLFGVIFEGHPCLKRILLEDDFEGYPLLKDFVGKNVVKLPKI